MSKEIKTPGYIVYKIFVLVLMVLLVLLTITPLVFMVCASFMTSKQILAIPFSWIPNPVQFSNFYKAVAGTLNTWTFPRNMLNSFIVSIAVTLSTLLLAGMSGYGLAKFRFKGKNFVFITIMSTMMIPFEAIMIPMYMISQKLHLMNSYMGLIIPYLVSAFGIFQMRQYLLTFPGEYLDAARVDGMGELGIFLKLVMPNSAPVLATLAITTFRSQWDNLLWPLLVVQDAKLKTVPLYITSFSEEKHADEGALMAVALLSSLPMLIAFFALSKYFIGGSEVYESRKG
ncbi:MAG: carbohydrate ABC transporter permease [Spirochaetales bacterium]|nr:carbohydrate ABC transporter permease [Spirochaetales bacterium]